MKLNRSFNQRKALLRTQLNSFISLGRITTTEAKGKLLKPIIEKMITKAKANSVHVRRQLAAELASTASANRLVDTIAPLFSDVQSGFTTLSKVKIRKGDAVTVVSLKLTRELPAEVKEEKKEEKKEVKAEAKVSTKKK